MKSNALFNKVIFLTAVFGIVTINSAFSQGTKKKIVRVIEVDDKGERVVKEYNVSNNAAKFDSLTVDVKRRMKMEQIKIDSLRQVLMINLPNHSEFPPIPEMPDFDFNFHLQDLPSFESGTDRHFEFVTPDSADGSSKIYYSEKNFDKSGNLDKILEDLEKGTFDPQKWSMKEVDKDKIKDFKTKGKGEVIVIGNRIAPPHIRHIYVNPHRKDDRYRIDVLKNGNGNRMIYINGDSLNKKDIETYTIEVTGDKDEAQSENIVILSSDRDRNPNAREHRKIFYITDSLKNSKDSGKTKTYTIETTNDSDDANCEKKIVVYADGNKSNNIAWFGKEGENKEMRTVLIVNDKITTKLNFTNPNAEELIMLEKTGFAKEDKSKLLSIESLVFIPKKEKDMYSIRFQEKETGKVKVIISDVKGKVIKTEEFEHSNGRTERDVEIKDLKSGVYYIQAQLNGKTTTSKIDIKID